MKEQACLWSTVVVQAARTRQHFVYLSCTGMVSGYTNTVLSTRTPGTHKNYCPLLPVYYTLILQILFCSEPVERLRRLKVVPIL